MLLASASIVLVVAAAFAAIENGATAVIPLSLAAVIASVLVIQLRKRRLLSSGTATVGRVVSANKAKGILGVEYEYPTPSGMVRGSTGIDLMRVRRAFGFVPAESDTVFIVFDPAQPRRSAVWGFAKRRTDREHGGTVT